MSTSVLLETDGAVATLTLNRPERLNTITQQVAQDVRARLEEAQRDDAIRVIRLRGAGRAFCAGYDIDWGAESMQESEGDRPWDPMADLAMMSRFVDTYMALWRSPKPVISQVHGCCVGGGTDFAKYGTAVKELPHGGTTFMSGGSLERSLSAFSTAALLRPSIMDA